MRILAAGVLAAGLCVAGLRIVNRSAALAAETPAAITVDYPLNGSTFPPDMASPTFQWRDSAQDTKRWEITVAFADGSPALHVSSKGEGLRMGEIDERCISANNRLPELTPEQAEAHTWKPNAEEWQWIHRHVMDHAATITVTGFAEGAEKYFQQSLRSNPEFADALLELANLRIAEKRLPEAEDLLRRFVRVSRDPSTGYYKLAMAERSLHETAAADRDLNSFKTLSRSEPGGPYPYQHLFDYLDNRAQLAPAAREQLDIDELTKQTREHPDQPQDMYLLAEAYLKAGNLEQAREIIAQLDKLSNGDYRTLTGLGVLLARYRAYQDAVQHFQAALAANPNADDARFDLADTLFRERHYADALEQAQKISPEGQKDDALLSLLGDINAHLGNTAQAAEIYRNAIARNPDDDQDYLSLALIQLRANDLDGAKQTLLKGQGRIPGSGKIFWGLGLVAVLEGDNARAAEHFERAVDLLPEWPGGYSALGVFYFQSGQIDKAREVLNRFKDSSARSSLDIDRIEQVLDQASASSITPSASLSMADRAQFLQMALSLADRTL